jgi:hypothetical protein
MSMRQTAAVRVHEWVTVSARESCPRCGAITGCQVAEDAGAVRCLTMPSERPLVGGGWFHDLQSAVRR